MEKITPQQTAFFETFGYIVMPGLIKDEISWVTDEFEQVFRDKGIAHDATKRTCVVPFIDQRERLCTLLDHPKIEGLAASLIGDDFTYTGSDGNYYTGDTSWHSDGFHSVGKHLKIAIYLDPVARDTGALRVIPGTHRIDDDWSAKQAVRSRELWGIEGRDVPAVALESQPGDVVAFNHNLMHAAFGGNTRRRMFTLNSCRRAETPEEVADLRAFIAGGARFWVERVHGERMRETASPQRMRHLEQGLEHESLLPPLVAKARLEMSEPARG